MRRKILTALLGASIAAGFIGLAVAGQDWESITYANSAQALTLWQGTAWVGTTGGLVQWDLPSGTPQVHLAPEGFLDNSVTAVAVDAEGRPWIGLGTWNGGLAVLADGEWVSWGSEDGLASNWVTCLAIDSAGRKWVGTVRGVTVLDDGGTPADRSDDRGASFGTHDGLADETVNSLRIDEEGRVWFATSGGLSVLAPGPDPFDASDDVWTSFKTADGLLADASQGVAVDEAGRVWIGARGGVSILDFGVSLSAREDDAWTRIGSEHGISSSTTCYGVTFRAGTAWIPTSKGLIALEGAATPSDASDDRVTTFVTSDGLLGSNVRAVSFDSAGIASCAVLPGGLSRLDFAGTPSDKSDDSWASYVVEGWLPGADVRTVLAEEGVTWTGSSGLTAFGGGRIARFNVGIPLALDRSDAGVLWVATTGGLTALDDARTPFDTADDMVTFFSASDGLPVGYGRAVSVDPQNRVWVATSAGIAMLDPMGTPHDKSDDRWAVFTTSDGLASNNANALVADGDRRVWIVHESSSVSCLDHGGTPFDKADDMWVLFGEGSPIGSASGYSVVVDTAGVKWFGLCPGLFAFDDGGTLADTSDDRWQRFDLGDCNPGLAIDDAGRKWVATGWSGVAVVDDGGTPFDGSDDAVTTYAVADGLIDDRAQAISVFAGVVWIGTDGGLSKLVP